VMLTVFFDSRGVVHHEYAPQGQNINKEYYLEVLRCLHDAVRLKRPNVWATETWQLHHDHAPAHSSQLIQTFLAKHNIPVVRQAPCSPKMASCDFWLFPKLKTQRKETRFESQGDIIRNTTAKLYSIRKEAFQKCFEQWRNRWEKCVVTRRLLQRGLGLQTSRRVNVFFPAKGRILFEQATYMGGRYSYLLRAVPSGVRIPMWTRFFLPVQTGLKAHQTSCTMCTRSLSRGYSGVNHPLLSTVEVKE